MAKSRGLPPDLRTRADAHYVDHITSGRPTAVGRMIEIGKICPNPTQPRRDMRDIEELSESIRERGILEPILVRQTPDGTYQIIAGERRYQAAQMVGLSLVPCVELDVDEKGCLEISLIENLQRRDLNPFEEAEAIGRLLEDFAYTHEQVARKLGRSRSGITEILSLNRMPESVKELCRRADILTRSTLMEIVRQRTEEAMLALAEAIASENLTRDEVRELKRSGEPLERRENHGGPKTKPFVFKYRPPNRDFSLSLKFEKEVVEPKELLTILEQIVIDLKNQIEGRSLSHPGPGKGVRGAEPEAPLQH